MKQKAYALNSLTKGVRSKKEAALMSGYSESAANSVAVKIEGTEGYSNAMRDIAAETGNVVLEIYHTIKNKDLSKEDFKTLVNAAGVLAGAFERFNGGSKKEATPEKINNLKVIFQNHAKGATVDATAEADTIQDQE